MKEGFTVRPTAMLLVHPSPTPSAQSLHLGPHRSQLFQRTRMNCAIRSKDGPPFWSDDPEIRKQVVVPRPAHDCSRTRAPAQPLQNVDAFPQECQHWLQLCEEDLSNGAAGQEADDHLGPTAAVNEGRNQ